MGSPLCAVLRIAVYMALTLVLLPVQIVAVALDRPLARSLPRFYHRLCCRILGFRIETRGEISAVRPTLFIANHVSYIDIVVLGALLETSFVAKAEIERWPFFGLLARLQRTVFVDRRGFKAATQRSDIHRRLEAGDNLVLFPEGTSGDGLKVEPFKSALFAVAQDTVRDRPLVAQPLSIAYTRLDGVPLGRSLRPRFAWYGAMTLVPHLWTMMGLGTVTVCVAFHPPVDGSAFPSRKALADHCHRVVSAGLQAANSGRPLAPPVAEPAPALPVASAAGQA